MTSGPDRQEIAALVAAATEAGARPSAACAAAGLSPRTLRRWQGPDGGIREDRRPSADRPAPANKLTEEEGDRIVATCATPEFASLPPSQIVPRLADMDIWIASESSFYRVLRERGQNHRRGRARPAARRKPPTSFEAKGPCQVWSWDITWLPEPIAGTFFYLYLIVDIFSRKIVGWEVHDRETSEFAAEVLRRAVWSERCLTSPLVLHPRVEMATQTEDDWDAAGAVGYGFTSRGAEGNREALDVIRARPCITRKQGGPQAIFGRLYQWLQYNKSGKDRGPIRDVVREYFLDTMPIEPGTKLFGEPVEVRRRHSVASLARQFGLNYRTMNRALALTGVMPDGDADVLDRLLTVDAVAGERLADRMRRSLSMAAMPEYLNCGRLQAEALIRHRVIPRIGENPSTGQFGLNSIAVEDVDAFLDRFRSAGGNTGPPRTEFANVVEASRILRCPAIGIIKLVLAGRLSRVALLPYELKLKSVLVDPEEVRTRLRDGGTDGRLSVIQAAERLGLEAWAVRNLTVATDQEGRVLLPAIEGTDAVADAKGRPIGFFMSAGQVSDYSGAAALLGSLPKADWLLADRGYDADWLREALKDKGMKVCIPGRKSRKKAVRYDKRRYKRRNRIEIMFGRLKDWRRVATRYDRSPETFFSAIALAAIVLFGL